MAHADGRLKDNYKGPKESQQAAAATGRKGAANGRPKGPGRGQGNCKGR